MKERGSSELATGEQAVRDAVVNLYCRAPEAYVNYRQLRPSATEVCGWSAVDGFVRRHNLLGASIIDLGCGSGSDHMPGWEPCEYVGYDISSYLLNRHVLRGRKGATLSEADISNIGFVDDVAVGPPGSKTLILSVLALHYLRRPSAVIERFRRPGHWFCFLVANAEHDRSMTTTDGVVRLRQDQIEFTYFSHALPEYVAGLKYPRELAATQCGYDEGAAQHPYYLIGGRW